uniref:Cytochrome c oxidase assembly factor 1 homolog n=1 Tax=Capra hircus TaxID=9925 RepID=A0A8C2NBP0_CAPHI
MELYRFILQEVVTGLGSENRRMFASVPQSLTEGMPPAKTLQSLKMFSRASYYQLALEQLHSHPEALEALGTPLNVHYLRLTDKYNFVDIADAKLKIPVSGPKSEGHLYVSSSRDAPFKRWNLQEVFLELKDGQQIPLFKPSRDNDEVKKE